MGDQALTFSCTSEAIALNNRTPGDCQGESERPNKHIDTSPNGSIFDLRVCVTERGCECVCVNERGCVCVYECVFCNVLFSVAWCGVVWHDAVW